MAKKEYFFKDSWNDLARRCVITESNMKQFRSREVILCALNIQQGRIRDQENSLYSPATYDAAKTLLTHVDIEVYS